MFLVLYPFHALDLIYISLSGIWKLVVGILSEVVAEVVDQILTF
jgi:hypothetical protein